MAVMKQVPRQFTVSAPQVEDRRVGGDGFHCPQHARLQPLASGRKLDCEGLVE